MRPLPPFGNVSNADNPEVPVGDVYPACSLASNRRKSEQAAAKQLRPHLRFELGQDWKQPEEGSPAEPPRFEQAVRCYRAGPPPSGIGLAGAAIR